MKMPWVGCLAGSAAIAAACGGSVDGLDGPRAEGDAGAPPPARVDGGGVTKPPPPPCGNGQVDRGEECDGRDLSASTCSSVTMGRLWGGTLQCDSRCTFDTSRCEFGDSAGGRPNMGGSGGFGTGGMGGAGAGGRGAGGFNGGSAGATYGDPHIFTADGLEYDFQAVGEFILLEDALDPSFVVQVRQQPFKSFATLSSNGAVAALVAGDRVAIYAGSPPVVRIDGTARPVETSLHLPRGGRITNEEGTYTVSWPTGEALVVNATWSALLNVSYVPGPRGLARKLRGLLGQPDGDPSNDLTTRTGQALSCSGCGDQIYDVFGASYRVTMAEALFDYETGQTTAHFTDLDFPYGPRTTAALHPDAMRLGFLACVTEGVTDPAALEACTADVALTGDLGFARAAAARR